MAYYALKKDVFDISKVTVVGSPTITSDGVASGFSASNYINIPVIFDATKDFNINLKFRLNSYVSHPSTLFRVATNTHGGGDFGFLIAIDPSGYIYDSGFTDTDKAHKKIELNVENDLNIKKQDGLFYIYLNGDLLRSDVFSKNIPTAYMTLGGKTITSNLETGSINLKSFKIYVGGQLIYSPTKPTYLLERRKEGYDPSKFTIVGSPTITEYGVASGFSGTSYLTYNPFTYSTSLEIYFAVTPNGNGKLDGILGTFESTTYRGIKLDNTIGNTFRLWLSSDGVNYDICNAKTGNATNLTNNVLNYFRLIWDGATYKLQHSLDMKIWNDVIVVASSLKINTSYSWIIGGTSKSDRLYGPLINGSIDLPSISITVDGKEVFTGSKYVYYAMEK